MAPRKKNDPDIAQKFEYWDIAKIKPYEKNPRRNDLAADRLAEFFKKEGFHGAIWIKPDGEIIAGHTRWKAALKCDFKSIPVVVIAGKTEEQYRALRLWDNKSSELASWDDELLRFELGELYAAGFDLALTGFDDDELESYLKPIQSKDEHQANARASLQKRFGVPPFSILDARQGYWRERKEAWLSLGIQSEVGRGENLLKMSETILAAGDGAGTSIFDPVLCELAYRWYSPKGGAVLDPFAGGSVRGVVAALCDRQYTGIDLRAEQIEANRAQWAEIGEPDRPAPEWINGDSLKEIEKLSSDFAADLIFTCPPYFDLEQYSDDPADLSAMEYGNFEKAYERIIKLSCERLKADRFAVVVIGDVRDKAGMLRDLPGLTINAFSAAGLDFYNDAILVPPLGSAMLRAARIFEPARKLVKAHQYVMVFIKGDPIKATKACGPAEFGEVVLGGGSPSSASEPGAEFGEIITNADLGGELGQFDEGLAKGPAA